MLHFVRGRAKSGKSSYIINKIKTGHRKGTLLLVPEPYSHTAERALCEACGNEVSLFSEVISFRRLAVKARSEIGGLALETVSAARRILLLHSAIKRCAPMLHTFSSFAGNPELLSSVLGVIDEFKAYGISPESVLKIAGEVSPVLGRKLSDLSMIYAAYENALGEDEEDMYDEQNSVAKAIRGRGFFADKTLFLDGFSGFTAAQLDILETAISEACDVYITLETPREYERGAENGIFDKAFDTMARLSERAERHGVAVDDVYLEKREEGALSYLDEALFSHDNTAFSGDCGEITIARAGGVFEECELAAAYILDKVRENGARWRDFCVVLSSEEQYSGIVESVFSRYGVPVYTGEKGTLSEKPVIALICGALDCIMRSYKTDAVMAYLKTGFSGICRKSLDIFEDYLYVWSPRASEWASPEGFVHNPFGLTAEPTDESSERLATVNRVREKVYTPLERLRRSLQTGKSGIKCAEALYDFINDINLARRCDAYAYIAERAGRLQESQEYGMLFGMLCDAIDSIGRALGEEEISISELSSLFNIVVSQYELGTIPATLDCVNVCSIAHAEGNRTKYRIVLGANEGSFPSVTDSTGMLSDEDRQELSDLGIELAPAMCERMGEQFREIHAALNGAERELYISSSSLLRGGEEALESPFVSRLRKIFSGYSGGLSVHEARLRARVPCFDECMSAKSGLEYWKNDSEYAQKLKRAEQNAHVPRGPVIDRENISAVFGRSIALSASRAELFSSCRYAYFMKYGIKARPRLRAEVSPIEAGTLMHYVLEETIRELSKSGDYDIQRAKELATEACERFVSENMCGSQKLSARTEAMIKRLCRTVQAAVEDICRELSDSEFSPCDFELRFADGDGDLPAIPIDGSDCKITLRGAVDRVDSFEKDDKLYFRVIDYKSGRKEFSLDETVNGIGMQLLLYMFALEELGEQRYKKPTAPAGVMYVRISGEMPRGRGKVATNKREGVVLRDMSIINAMEKSEKKVYLPVSVDKNGGLGKKSSVLTAKEFEAVKLRMKSILKRIGDELSNGEVEINPYYTSDRTACDYCEYMSVCGFDDRLGDDRRRDLFEVRMKDISESGEVRADG